MDITQLEQQNALLQQQLDVFAEAIRQQKLAMEESDARVAELTDIVNHLSEKLRERDELIKEQEAQLNALRSASHERRSGRRNHQKSVKRGPFEKRNMTFRLNYAVCCICSM